jgi:hypothetical protein
MDVNPVWFFLWPLCVLVVLTFLFVGVRAFFAYRQQKFEQKPPSKRRPWRP